MNVKRVKDPYKLSQAQKELPNVNNRSLAIETVIFEHLWDPDFKINNTAITDSMKRAAIVGVASWPTHNSITKDALIAAMCWLIVDAYEVTNEETGEKLKGGKS